MPPELTEPADPPEALPFPAAPPEAVEPALPPEAVEPDAPAGPDPPEPPVPGLSDSDSVQPADKAAAADQTEKCKVKRGEAIAQQWREPRASVILFLPRRSEAPLQLNVPATCSSDSM
jgi:hypothetical protein